jgi:hypothetical protein
MARGKIWFIFLDQSFLQQVSSINGIITQICQINRYLS